VNRRSRRTALPKPKPKRQDGNRLLASLPAADYRRLAAQLEPLAFRRGQPLHGIHQPIANVYFPRNGVASVVTRMSEGGALEVATIGNEGIVGLAVHLGDGRSPMETFVQIPGDAARLEVRGLSPGAQDVRAAPGRRRAIRPGPADPGRAVCRLQPGPFGGTAVRAVAPHVP
jgi:hypothetical protein